MHLIDRQLGLSATDLASFLACRRKTALDHAAMRGDLRRPAFSDPVLEILRQRGAEHEARFVERERAAGHEVVDLSTVEPREDRVAATLAAMRRGAARIVQASLTSPPVVAGHSSDRSPAVSVTPATPATSGVPVAWSGYADMLRRIETPSPLLGAWSYEVVDTKLALETRAATVLQLSLYSDLLAEIQGVAPEHFYVVTPLAEERYRVSDYAAYYRLVRRGLEAAAGSAGRGVPAPPPEPVAHCEICEWRPLCTQKLREDDHLSFVANCARRQRVELAEHGITTLERLGRDGLPDGLRPSRGSRETYRRLQQQARLQLHAREAGAPSFETLPIEPEKGFCLLPAPSPGDVFFDIESAAWARPSTHPGEPGGREYLFGLVTIGADSEPRYEHWTAVSDAEEQRAFETVIDRLLAAVEAHPDMHVYHYAPYEPAALKRLMGRYATRGPELDRLLRGHRFIDLYAIVRHALRAGIESYSIKELERFYGFMRKVPLDRAGHCRRLVEHALDVGAPHLIDAADFDVVRQYNEDDCVSTLRLRDWLECLRDDALARGDDVPRPPLDPGDPSAPTSQRDLEAEELRARLLEGVAADLAARTDDERARYQLAYLIDWHRREEKAVWWEYFRLRGLPEEDLLDEPKAVAGLEFAGEVEKIKRSYVHRYAWPAQLVELRPGDALNTSGDGNRFAKVVRIDRDARTLDILVGSQRRKERPRALFQHDHVSPGVVEGAIRAFGARVADAGSVAALPPCPERTLLLREPPRLTGAPFVSPPADASVTDYAVNIVTRLDRTALAIQGPPGSGKTYTGARMIVAAVEAGLRVGVTANSHKVIRNLLNAVGKAAGSRETSAARISIGHKVGDDDLGDEAGSAEVKEFGDNDAPVAALASGAVNVLGGTAWLWARPGSEGVVDLLFVDEAGQMALANVLAVSRAASSLVLLGDPKQLDQPSKAAHPEGVDGSALAHVLDGADTMPPGRGLFLPVTWRLAPSICTFTSERFYAGELVSRAGLERQVLAGNGRFEGAGLWLVPVAHDGNCNASEEEATEVAAIVETLLASGSTWIDRDGVARQLGPDDIRIVAPFNAHVQRLREALGPRRSAERRPSHFERLPVGTVDKFQGQEAPVVIYSMATSHPDDAPRGMEFLYSLNRLNVATSRAQCAAIVVASPRLIEPECRTPRQMRLANALCRYRELAREA